MNKYKHQYFEDRIKWVKRANMWAIIRWVNGEAKIDWSSNKPKL